MTQYLRPALLMNAGFSMLTGLLLAIAPGTVGDWLGVSIDGWLRLIGVALIGHAALITLLLPRMELRSLAKLNFAAIAGYPMLMLGLVLTGLIDRGLGQALAIADGAVVAGIATLLAQGLWKQPSVRHPQHA